MHHTPFPDWTSGSFFIHMSSPLTQPSLISLGLMLHLYKRNHDQSEDLQWWENMPPPPDRSQAHASFARDTN